MARKHLKRLCAPKSWGILRKEEQFIIKPQAGAHTLSLCLPISVLLKRLGHVNTTKEARSAIRANPILIDGKRIKTPKAQAGLMDVCTIHGETFRILINNKGHLTPVKTTESESGFKPCKITRKKTTRGSKTYLHTIDGRTIITDKQDQYRVGDTILIAIPEQRIISHHPLETGAIVYLIGGKHLGEVGVITTIKDDTIAYLTSNGNTYTTLKTYAFALGKEKPLITLP